MPDTNQSFDLPRWQTHVEPLSSSAQAAHAANATYIYSAPPPPPPQSISAASPQRLQPIHQSSRHRVSQLIDDQQPPLTSPYLSTGHNQLARSASLGGSASGNTPSSRARRHHQQEDLESAFNVDSQSRPSNQLPQSSFYPPPATYQQQSLSGPGSIVNSASTPTDTYTEMYYNGSATQQAKRAQPSLEPSSSAHATRSPLRGPASASLMESYSQQSQYSPTTANYPYAPPQDQRTHPASYQSQSHSRNHSQVKSEAMTPPITSSYTSHNTALTSSGPYSPNYAMDTSSPHPPALQTHLSAHPTSRQNPVSNPPTPLSYLHSQSPASQFYSSDQMAVDPPPQRRRPFGFRRVRTVHDLQPRTDVPITGRRMTSDGTYLSVSDLTFQPSWSCC